jgi:4-hydroxyphenylacetate 3-monooxygenase
MAKFSRPISCCRARAQSAKERMKLLKLAWDLLGSDFVGRHMQYEKFYAGPSFVMNSYSYLTGPWKDWSGLVDELLASYDAPCAEQS